MSNDEKVEIHSKKSLPKQWMNGVFHHNLSRRRSLKGKYKVALGAATFLAFIAPFIFNNQTGYQPDQSSGQTAKGSDSLKFPIGVLSLPEPTNTTQRGKRKYLKPRAYHPPKVYSRPELKEIPPGIQVLAELITGGSNGPVKAKSLAPLRFLNETIARAGTIFLGKGHSTEKRLLIRFSKMITPEGKIVSINAQAADHSDQIAGIKGSRLSGYAWKIASSAGLNFVSGYAEGLKKKEAKNGAVVESNNQKNALLNGASLAAVDVSREVMSDIKNRDPVIEVKKGTKLHILFEEN